MKRSDVDDDMKIIKEDFIREIIKTGIPETDATKIINSFLNSISSYLQDENSIGIKNLGTFKVLKKKKESFINPRTRKMSTVTKIKKVKFTPSRNLIKYINREL